MSTRSKINLLRPLALALTALAVGSVTRAEPLISEFMAANSRTHADNDGAFSDWVEIHNPDAQAISLEGWHLTDTAANKTKWKFPAVILPAGGYMVVYASNKNRTDPAASLHANFALSADGEYLGLIKPDGATVAHEYAPRFPAQSDDISYGLVQNPDGTSTAGFLSAPTPGASNAGAQTGGGAGGGNVADDEVVTFSRPSGLFRTAFMVELSGADVGQQIRYTVSTGVSPAAVAEPTVASAAYTAPINIQGSATIRAAVFDANGGRGPVASVVYTKIGNSVANFSSQLPVLVLDTMGTGPLVKDDIDHVSALSVYAPRGGAPVFFGTPELLTPLESSVRGSSSAEFPKKGYNVKFTDEAGDKKAQPLLDMAAAEKWAFVGPWSFDFSYLNNSLVYGLSNQMGRWAPRTRFAEMFFNADGNDLDYTDYAGIYTLTERIEVGTSRVNIRKLSSKDTSGDALTGGYILKIDPADPDEIGWTTPHGVTSNSSIVLVAPKADDIVPEQLDYIQNFTRQMEAALVRDQATGFAQRSYLDYIDRASWVDYHLLTVFTSNPDGLVRSTYFHKDRGGKLVAGPVWDYDRALGSFWDQRSRAYDEWFGLGSPDYWNTGWWGILARDPEFMQEWIDRWQALRRTTFSEGNLTEMVRTLGNSIGETAAARDAARWPDNAPVEGSYAAEVDYKRYWVVGRAGWIDQQFVAPPTVAHSGGSITFTAPAQAQLVYTLDGSDPRAQGGAIAPGATIANGPLTVAGDANVHVRAYRADQKDTFPGTPWSSAVGGEQSSPLTPKARLINISSRATVGSGANALIMGVTVADTEGKRYLSRGVGPGLVAFGASGVVTDPQLSIYGPTSAELFRNNGWETGIDASRLPGYARTVGAFPLVSGSADSALASQIGSGGYTVQISTPSGQEGIGLAELYELEGKGRTVNLSTRARVGTGDGVLIGGFVVSGPAYKRLLIRGVGPTLSAFGLTDALADPVLTVRSGENVVATNDRWQSGANTAAVAVANTAVGAFNLANGSEDAAMVVTLPPGAYTVEIAGKSGQEGIALLEIYELP